MQKFILINLLFSFNLEQIRAATPASSLTPSRYIKTLEKFRAINKENSQQNTPVPLPPSRQVSIYGHNENLPNHTQPPLNNNIINNTNLPNAIPENQYEDLKNSLKQSQLRDSFFNTEENKTEKHTSTPIHSQSNNYVNKNLIDNLSAIMITSAQQVENFPQVGRISHSESGFANTSNSNITINIPQNHTTSSLKKKYEEKKLKRKNNKNITNQNTPAQPNHNPFTITQISDKNFKNNLSIKPPTAPSTQTQHQILNNFLNTLPNSNGQENIIQMPPLPNQEKLQDPALFQEQLINTAKFLLNNLTICINNYQADIKNQNKAINNLINLINSSEQKKLISKQVKILTNFSENVQQIEKDFKDLNQNIRYNKVITPYGSESNQHPLFKNAFCLNLHILNQQIMHPGLLWLINNNLIHTAYFWSNNWSYSFTPNDSEWFKEITPPPRIENLGNSNPSIDFIYQKTYRVHPIGFLPRDMAKLENSNLEFACQLFNDFNIPQILSHCDILPIFNFDPNNLAYIFAHLIPNSFAEYTKNFFGLSQSAQDSLKKHKFGSRFRGLDFSNCYNFDPQRFQNLFNSFIGFNLNLKEHLNYLNLANSKLNEEALNLIFNLPLISELDLTSCTLQVGEFPNFLQKNLPIEKLTLRSIIVILNIKSNLNQAKPLGKYPYVFAAILKHCTSLTFLDLSYLNLAHPSCIISWGRNYESNKLGNSTDSLNSQFIFENYLTCLQFIFQKNPHLKCLNLAFNHITLAGITSILSQSLRYNMPYLELSGNQINKKEIKEGLQLFLQQIALFCRKYPHQYGAIYIIDSGITIQHLKQNIYINSNKIFVNNNLSL